MTQTFLTKNFFNTEVRPSFFTECVLYRTVPSVISVKRTETSVLTIRFLVFERKPSASKLEPLCIYIWGLRKIPHQNWRCAPTVALAFLILLIRENKRKMLWTWWQIRTHYCHCVISFVRAQKVLLIIIDS